ncbi:MAG: PH domain-containing protein [Candidatus Chaera renei]|uniref:PH domain-containing protein n=1 Tax=Candidatus Chaera renei TaxID=2506947 RepID=A0A4Q0AJL8_9BACT|nr:MAG: PH domain-containing protein [Candidatus Chaera renei]
MNKQFEGQHDDETVLLVFRRHPIAMRKGFYALLVPIVVTSIPVLIWPQNAKLLYLWLGGFALGLLLFAYHWVGWYFSLFIVTDQRIRQISQKGMFGKSVIDLGLSKIQNISYNIPGLTGEMLGYGTIAIQTYVGDLILDKVHHPAKIYNNLQTILKQVDVNPAELPRYENN